MVIKKVNTDFYIKVDTNYKVLGRADTFECFYFNGNSGVIANPFEELVREILVPRTADVLQDANIGDTLIYVTNNNINAGDVITDNINNYYYVLSSVDDRIVIRGGLQSTLPAGSTLTQAGNTGIYRVKVNMSDAGEYVFVIANKLFGVSKSITIKIVPEEYDDKLDKIIELATFKVYV